MLQWIMRCICTEFASQLGLIVTGSFSNTNAPNTNVPVCQPTKIVLPLHDLKILSSLGCWEAWWHSFGDQLLEQNLEQSTPVLPTWKSLEPSYLSSCALANSQKTTGQNKAESGLLWRMYSESKSRTTQGVNRTRKDHGMLIFYTIVISLKQTYCVLTITKRQRTE